MSDDVAAYGMFNLQRFCDLYHGYSCYADTLLIGETQRYMHHMTTNPRYYEG